METAKLRQLIIDNLEETYTSFCRKVGVSRATLDKIINDRLNGQTLHLLTIKKICKYFNVDFHDYI